jgi:hypothetical protein
VIIGGIRFANRAHTVNCVDLFCGFGGRVGKSRGFKRDSKAGLS